MGPKLYISLCTQSTQLQKIRGAMTRLTHPLHPSWSQINLAIWTPHKTNIGVISACLPTLHHLFSKNPRPTPGFTSGKVVSTAVVEMILSEMALTRGLGYGGESGGGYEAVDSLGSSFELSEVQGGLVDKRCDITFRVCILWS